MNLQPLFKAAHHPVVMTPSSDNSEAALAAYLADNAEQVAGLLREHGGILLRGFAVDGAESFARLCAVLGGKAGSYVGGNSPRTRLAQDVYTSTEFPASETISLHNEMSYLPNWPKRLFFYCQVPAASGGQTTLAHGGDLLQALPAGLVQQLREKRICYIRNFQAKARMGKSWQSTYQTESRDEAEQAILAQGSSFRWGDDGSLRVSTVCDATLTHPETGQEVWFNQAEQWHPSALAPALRKMFEQAFGVGGLAHHCTFGDGEPIDEAMLAEVRAVMNGNKLLFDWQAGDMLVIDNVTMLHGREPFKGERKTLVFLSAA